MAPVVFSLSGSALAKFFTSPWALGVATFWCYLKSTSLAFYLVKLRTQHWMCMHVSTKRNPVMLIMFSRWDSLVIDGWRFWETRATEQNEKERIFFRAARASMNSIQ
jgi:hypothetical protein